jgi:hypothetical protein
VLKGGMRIRDKTARGQGDSSLRQMRDECNPGTHGRSTRMCCIYLYSGTLVNDDRSVTKMSGFSRKRPAPRSTSLC